MPRPTSVPRKGICFPLQSSVSLSAQKTHSSCTLVELGFTRAALVNEARQKEAKPNKFALKKIWPVNVIKDVIMFFTTT